jgi:sterol desaturase/sphingolipid hydroxylase (fatty acid hydroxylase superfamily)
MDLSRFMEIWKGMLLFDFFRYFIPASLAFLIFWLIGRKTWNHLFIQKSFPKQKQFWKEFGYSMSTVMIFSFIGIGVLTSEKAGITLLYHDLKAYGIVYMIFSLVVAIVFHDFYFYWTHRFMHHKRVFKYVHSVHHESTNPSPWAAYSFHPWEAVIQAMVLPILVFILPLHDLTIFIFLAYMIVRNVMGHLGFEILPKGFTKNKWWNWNTAITHHNMHHQYFNRNYGLYFTWWDKLMKTEHEKYHENFNEVKSRPKVCKLKSRKKEAITISILLVCSTFTSAQNVEGKWTTYNEETGSPLSIIEIVKNGNGIEGKVYKIYLEPYQGEDPICSKCKGERKGKKVLNMNFLWGFKKDGTHWSGGKILDPETGEEYNSKLWLEDGNTLKVRGYGGMMDLFYRTQTWKRVVMYQAKTPVGLWNTVDDTWDKEKSQVEIIENEGQLFGYIRKLFLLPHEGTDPVCIQCEGKLKNQKIVGMTILSGFKWNGEKWEQGKILDPGNGNTYSSSLWLMDQNTLKVRGYLGPFYRTQTWKKLQTNKALK